MNRPEILRVVLALALAAGCSGVRPEHSPYAPTPEENELERCKQLRKGGEQDKSLACLASMCGREPPFARACYERSRLLFQTGGDEDGRTATVEFIERFPGDALAPTAAKRLARSYSDTEEWDLGAKALVSLAAKVEGTEVYDSVLYSLATLYKTAGRTDDEVLALERLVGEHGRWDSQLWDDSMWRLCVIHRERGDKKAEKKSLLKLLKTRKKSYLIGSYNSRYHDDALLRLGYIRFEEGDSEGALGAFKELSDNKKSRLRDEGRIGSAEVEAALGNRRAACGILRDVTQMPSATGRKRAEELIESLKCDEF